VHVFIYLHVIDLWANSNTASRRTAGDEPLGGEEAGDANHGTEEAAEQLPSSLKV
jgi:hypothetical protein